MRDRKGLVACTCAHCPPGTLKTAAEAAAHNDIFGPRHFVPLGSLSGVLEECCPVLCCPHSFPAEQSAQVSPAVPAVVEGTGSGLDSDGAPELPDASEPLDAPAQLPSLEASHPLLSSGSIFEAELRTAEARHGRLLCLETGATVAALVRALFLNNNADRGSAAALVRGLDTWRTMGPNGHLLPGGDCQTSAGKHAVRLGWVRLGWVRLGWAGLGLRRSLLTPRPRRLFESFSRYRPAPPRSLAAVSAGLGFALNTWMLASARAVTCLRGPRHCCAVRLLVTLRSSYVATLPSSFASCCGGLPSPLCGIALNRATTVSLVACGIASTGSHPNSPGLTEFSTCRLI